jgi:DNA polymerase III subunit epsilon
MRQITLDTETTGLLYYKGHRIIEIGCVEIINRKITGKFFHTYINPERNIDEDAKKITGVTEYFLKDKPKFKEIVKDFLNFINNTDEIIIHNSNFDTNFINNELKIINHDIKNISEIFKILDTLNFARKIHPGKKNSLDALCLRYNVDLDKRKFHGALLDANLLAEVYLKMTENQTFILPNNNDESIIEINNQNIKNFCINIKENKKHIKYIKSIIDNKVMI